MRHYSRLVGVASVLVLVSAFIIAPLSAGAFWDGFPFGKPGIGSDSSSGIQAGPVTLCPRTITAAGISVNVFIPNKRGCDTPPPPPPPPVDECPNVPGTQDEGPCADEVCEDEGGTWDGDSCEFPPPHDEPTLEFSADPTTITQGGTSTLAWDSDNTDSCEASNGWSGTKSLDGTEFVTPSATTTYTLECVGDGGTTTESVVVNVVIPGPPPVEGKVLITEVLYDLTTGTTTPQGDEPANEWVEIFNGTNSSINLSNYTIADASSTDALPDVVLPAGTYAVITASSTTASFWSIPGDAVVVVLASNIGLNGLGNAGDFVSLFDEVASTTIDAVSWGTNTTAFSPSVDGVTTNSGHSIARDPVTEDTNSAADWEERTIPTPGE